MDDGPLFEGGLGEFEFTEVPIHFGQQEGCFPCAYVDLYLNAVRLSLPLDTGHSLGGLLLSPSVLSALDVLYTGRTRENWDAFGKRRDSREYLVPRVRIGALSLERVRGFELFTRWGTPGFIGLPFLRQFSVLIDYPNRRFGLYRQGISPECLTSAGWARVKLVSPGSGLVLPVKLGDCDETFHFRLDTGAAYIDQESRFHDIVCSQSALGELLRQRGAIEPYPADAEVLGRFATDQFRSACGYSLGRTDLVIVDSGYLRIDGLLGHSFFLEHSVFIDFAGEFRLKRRRLR